MAFITKLITVDVAKENTFQSIIAKQYDTDSRFLKVTLTNEGEQIVVSPTSTVTINALREDNNAKSFFGTVNEDGTVTVPLTYWMIELDGAVKCDISVIDTEQRKLTSTTFTITVEAASCSSADISEDENYDILVSLIAEVSKFTVDSELSAESENPVQNKAVKAALDNKLDNTAGAVKSANLADRCIAWKHIGDGQVTATKIAENAVYTRHIVDGNVTKAKLSSDLQTAIDTIGAVKVDALNIDTVSDGLYVTTQVFSNANMIGYSSSSIFLVFVISITAFEKRAIIIDNNGIYELSATCEMLPYFDTTIREESLNAPTTAAVYQAIQDALYVNTEEVIE